MMSPNLFEYQSLKPKKAIRRKELKPINNLKEIFMAQHPEVSTSSYILSITSIMESWSYEAQEKGQRYSDLKVEREYKNLCNSIIELN